MNYIYTLYITFLKIKFEYIQIKYILTGVGDFSATMET